MTKFEFPLTQIVTNLLEPKYIVLAMGDFDIFSQLLTSHHYGLEIERTFSIFNRTDTQGISESMPCNSACLPMPLHGAVSAMRNISGSSRLLSNQFKTNMCVSGYDTAREAEKEIGNRDKLSIISPIFYKNISGCTLYRQNEPPQ